MKCLLEVPELTPLVGFLGYYATVSGDIFSSRTVFLKKLKLRKSSRGYLYFFPRKGGKTHTVSAHSVIAKTFLVQPDGMTEVNHKNSIKTDNAVSNLEWSNRSLNNQHSWKTGRVAGKQCRITKDQAYSIKKLLAVGYRVVEVSRKLKINEDIVSQINRGLTWKYLDI